MPFSLTHQLKSCFKICDSKAEPITLSDNLYSSSAEDSLIKTSNADRQVSQHIKDEMRDRCLLMADKTVHVYLLANTHSSNCYYYIYNGFNIENPDNILLKACYHRRVISVTDTCIYSNFKICLLFFRCGGILLLKGNKVYVSFNYLKFPNITWTNRCWNHLIRKCFHYN